MKIADRAKNIQESLARRLFGMSKKYDDVIDLTLGDPDLPTPELLKEAAIDSIKNNLTHYSANAGLLDARMAVSKNIENVWNIKADPESEILLTVGGMEALFLSLFSVVDPGDEVIIFSPYYPNYVQMICSCGGVPVILDTYSTEQGLYIDESKLRSILSDKTVAIILNSPNNPTGAVFSSLDLQKIADIACERDLLIISDEVYRTLIFDDKVHESVLKFPQAQNRTILIDSLSKEYCMTGWRVGYAYGPKEIIDKMTKLQENVASCTPLPSQYALIKAYGDTPVDKSHIVMEFQKRRDFIYSELIKIRELKCKKPESTFYIFVDIGELGISSYDFAEKLLLKEHVAVVPGSTYGEKYDHYVRIAFTKDITVLAVAINRINKFLEETQK